MDIKVPEVGESIFEALVARWIKENGAQVRRDEPLCELETDKITFDISAESDGVLTVLVPEGETVKIGAVIGTISEQGASQRVASSSSSSPPAAAPPTAADRAAIMPAARKLAAENGLDAGIIPGSGKGGRVTAEDVMQALPGGPQATGEAIDRKPEKAAIQPMVQAQSGSGHESAVTQASTEVSRRA